MARDFDRSALIAQAQRHLAAGRFDDAEAACHDIIAVRQDEPNALLILAATSAAQQRWHEAATFLLFGRTRHPNSIAFHFGLAKLFLQLGDFASAVEPFESCVLVDPGEREHRSKLVALYETCRFTSFRQSSKDAMLACLRDPELSHEMMQKAWLSLLRQDPEAREIVAALTGVDYESFERHASEELLTALQESEFFTLGLTRFLITDLEVERGLGFVRRWQLEHPALRQHYLPLCCALGSYCFAGEFLLLAEEDHSSLKRDPQTAADVALLACYEPLFHFADAAKWARLSLFPGFLELFRTQLEEPLAEARLRAKLSPTTPIASPVSQAVKRQYEENPYPRWTTLGRRPALPESITRQASGKQIFVAGCGSGREAADMALMFPAAQVLGIDLSAASLGYGMRRARELGLVNLSFEQADLLEFPALIRSFDLISCAGVLHHLKDAASGLRALLALLRPKGALRIALYSTAARHQLSEARVWAKQAGFPATAVGIRRFRAAIRSKDDSDPLKRQLSASYDFYSLSGCRDLVFHAQERTFSLPEVSALIRASELEVLRVETKNPRKEALYRARFPDDPGLSSLKNWAELEREQPLLFSPMYCFWLCRTAERGTVDCDWINLALR